MLQIKKRWCMLLFLLPLLLSCGVGLVLAKDEQKADFQLTLYQDLEQKDFLPNTQVFLTYPVDGKEKKEQMKEDANGVLHAPQLSEQLEKATDQFPLHVEIQRMSTDAKPFSVSFDVTIQIGQPLQYLYAQKEGVFLIQDEQAPVFASPIITPTGMTKGPVQIQVSAHDNQSKDDELFYRMENEPYQQASMFTITKNGEYTFYARDGQGNVSKPLSVTITFIDQKAPQIGMDKDPTQRIQITSKKQEANLPMQKDGSFFSDELWIRVPVIDEESGIAHVQLQSKEFSISQADVWYPQFPKQATAEFHVKLNKAQQQKGTFAVLIEDAMGNVQKIAITKETSNMISDDPQITMEQELPQLQVLQITQDAVLYKTQDTLWSDRHLCYRMQGKDAISGIYHMEILTGDGHLLVATEDNTTYQKEAVLTLDTASIPKTSWNKGTCELIFRCMDRAGNLVEERRRIGIDTTAPVVKSIYVNGCQTTLNTRGYDCMVSRGAQLRVELDDEIKKQPFPNGSSGIQSLFWYTIDAQGHKSNRKQMTSITGNTVWIPLKRNFKGYVYMVAMDHVGNITKDSHGELQYVSSGGIVLEDATIHSQSVDVQLNLPSSAYHDKTGYPLYDTAKKPTHVQLVVQDTHSGIQTISWQLKNGKTEDQKYFLKLRLHPKKKYHVKDTLLQDGMTWTITAMDHNLITRMEANIPLQGEGDAQQLIVEMQDWSNHQTQQQTTYSLDATSPKLSLQMNQEQLPQAKEHYYATDRKLEVWMEDRNFDPNGVQLQLKKNKETLPVSWHWERVYTQQEDTPRYRSIQTIKADGEYVLEGIVMDRTQKQSNRIYEAFTMDTASPKMTLTAPQQASFHHENQNIHLRLQEHSISPKQIKVWGQATWNHQNVSIPQFKQISQQGDVQELRLQCTENADYTLFVQACDDAGNITNSGPYRFTIDKQAPDIKIEGFKNHTAYNAHVKATITIQDPYLLRDRVRITMKGALHGNINLAMKQEKTTEGLRYHISDLPYEQRYDDLYTLQIEAMDKAGNKKQQTLVFSLNRFGSVYHSSLAQQASTWYSSPFAVDLKESNVSALHEMRVRVSVNGQGRILDRKEYTLTKEAGSWYQYTYHLPKKLFAKDGIYQLTLLSQDDAGHANESNDPQKSGMVSFGIDQSAPIIYPLNLQDGRHYTDTTLQAKFSIQDNYVLRKVVIQVNGKEIQYQQQEDQYVFPLYQNEDSQQLRIIAEDAAGNQQIMNMNIWVQSKKESTIGQTSYILLGVGSMVLVLIVILLWCFHRKKNLYHKLYCRYLIAMKAISKRR